MFFSRVSFVSLAAVAFCALSVLSAPVDIERRQTGNTVCNQNRIATVQAVSAATTDVNSLATVGANDPTIANATTTAMSGLTAAVDGISTIGQSLRAGQTAPSEARTQVGQGLQTAQTALASVNSTDATVNAALAQAQTDISDAITAGEGVVANCN